METNRNLLKSLLVGMSSLALIALTRLDGVLGSIQVEDSPARHTEISAAEKRPWESAVASIQQLSPFLAHTEIG
jgi:hypothetical protein